MNVKKTLKENCRKVIVVVDWEGYPRGPDCPEGVLPRANIFPLGSTPQTNNIDQQE